MKRFSRPVFIVTLFLVVSSPVCFAETSNILSGRGLLRAVRERDGRSTKPAYAKRALKPAKPVPGNGPRQTAVKSANDKLLKTTLTNYTKDTKQTGIRSVLVPDVKGERADIAVRGLSSETVDLSGLTSETSFEEAIGILRNSVEPPLNIVVLWRDLEENAGIDRTMPINIDGVSGIRLGTVLKLLLESVSGGLSELGYVVEHGVIIIATKESLPRKLETRVYDVSYLLGRPANFYEQVGLFNMMGGFRGYGRSGGYGGYGGYGGRPGPARRGYYGTER